MYNGNKINPRRFEKDQIKIILIVLPLVIFMALPIVFIINHAFKPMEELFAFPPTFFARRWTFENFTKLMKASNNASTPLSRYVFNSLFVTVLTIVVSLLFTTAAAFSLSKLKYRGRNALLQINQIAIMFVSVSVLIPRYLVICFTGVTNTYFAHILPIAAVPVALFLVK